MFNISYVYVLPVNVANLLLLKTASGCIQSSFRLDLIYDIICALSYGTYNIIAKLKLVTV